MSKSKNNVAKKLNKSNESINQSISLSTHSYRYSQDYPFKLKSMDLKPGIACEIRKVTSDFEFETPINDRYKIANSLPYCLSKNPYQFASRFAPH